MMMLFEVIACACPSFDDMEFRSQSEEGSEANLDSVRRALEDFARWTGDEGVCVPGIEVRTDLAEPAWLSDEYESGGVYRGRNAWIWIDGKQSPDVYEATMHELCHAKDHLDDIATDNADVISDRANRDVVPESHWLREDFALACQERPGSATFDRALAETCGGEPTFDEEADFLLESVYPFADTLVVNDAVPISVTTIETSVWTGHRVFDATGWAGGVATLEEEIVPSDEDDWLGTVTWLRLYEPDLTTIRSEMRLLWAWWSEDVTFVRADVGLYVSMEVALGPGRDDISMFLEVDPVSGVVTPLPIDDTQFYTVPDPVISGDVLYRMPQPFRGDSLEAITVTGTPIQLEPTSGTFSASLWPAEMWPTPEGFGVFAEGGLGGYEAATGTWTREMGPPHVRGRLDLGDGRSLVDVGSRTWLIFDGSAWSWAGEPCQAPDGLDWDLAFAMDGSAYFIDANSVARVDFP